MSGFPAPTGFPAPAPVDERPPGTTFGDVREPNEEPTTATPVIPRKDQVRRVLVPGAKPIPEIQRYRQTNGSLYLTRFPYNGVWITGVGNNGCNQAKRI